MKDRQLEMACEIAAQAIKLKEQDGSIPGAEEALAYILGDLLRVIKEEVLPTYDNGVHPMDTAEFLDTLQAQIKRL